MRLGYQPRLDGLRAVAIVLVIGIHLSGEPPGGYMGVDLFFVLSGFLITTLLLEERQIHGSVSLSRFYARRALRLFPALWVFLFVSLALFGLEGRSHLLGAALGATYLTNVGVIAGHYDSTYGHLWSLAVEEQFYIAWPILLLVALRLRWRLWTILVAALAGAAALAAARYLLMPQHVGVRFGWETVIRFDSILVGCAVALLRRSSNRRAVHFFRRITGRFAVVAASTVCAALILLGGAQTTIYHGYTFAFSLAAAVLVVGATGGSRLCAPLEARPVVYVGKLSYALYLWHPIMQALITRGATRIEVLLSTFALAAASYHFVEQPFLRRKWRLARTSSHDAPIAMAQSDSAAALAEAADPR